jgi:hypothetical protein
MLPNKQYEFLTTKPLNILTLFLQIMYFDNVKGHQNVNYPHRYDKNISIRA